MVLLCFVLLLALGGVPQGQTLCPHEKGNLTRWSEAEPFKQLESGANITISTGLLLDVSPPPLNRITITTGGRLVFEPTSQPLLLRAGMIELTGGELWIGSEECPYTGHAEVLLTGRRGEKMGEDEEQKALVVRGGVLEIHGEPKRSWTVLTKTVHKTTRREVIGEPIYSVSQYEDLTEPGFHMYEFDKFGNPVKNWGVVFSPWTYVNVMRNTGNIVIIAISKWARFSEPHTPHSMATVFGMLCFSNTKISSMFNMADSEKVAFAAICHIGFPANSTEMIGQARSGRSQTGRLVKTIGNVDFAAISVVSLSSATSDGLTEIASYFIGRVPPLDRTLNLLERVDSWRLGDRIALASTDYHFNQAEEFGIVDCEECDEYQVKIEGPVWFTHWGEVTDGVDMRGEVALLTRNIRVHGEMEGECYGGSLCETYDYDTFGGQVKILENFTVVRIENAEFFHMGQQSDPGAYPIHFHMCLDTSNKHAYIRSNSIHHTFSRCVSIQGTHNLTIRDNVAYDHLGHCFFLEDGGEQDNKLIGNLGFGTKPSSMLPSEVSGKVSTFWITNPDNELVDNRAAGSDGNGIWILMPLSPIGPSAGVDMGLAQNQSTRTPVKAFHGNVAHSNKQFGLRLGDQLHQDGTTSTSIRYKPLEDPTNPESPLFQLRLQSFTAYKNTQGVWLKSMWTLCTDFHLAENGIGMMFASSDPEDRGPHSELLENSRIVGDTDNRGEPAGHITLQSGHVVYVRRSIPRVNPIYPQVGFVFYRGPVHVINTSFAGFKANVLRPAGAIGKKFSNRDFSSPISSIRNVTFAFHDPTEGSRFYDGDGTIIGFEELDGNRHNVLLDWDGSLTTYPRSSVVRPIPLLVNARCVLTPNWGPGTAICPDRFSRLKVTGSGFKATGSRLKFSGSGLNVIGSRLKATGSQIKVTGSERKVTGYRGKPGAVTNRNVNGSNLSTSGVVQTFLTRNDLMASETETSHLEGHASYSLNTQESYILHFNTTVPMNLTLSFYGLERGLSQLLGVCVGRNKTLDVRPQRYASVDSIEDVKADEANSKFYYDADVGVIFFRFTDCCPRGDLTTSNCPGNLDAHLNGVCDLGATITFGEAGGDGDCRNRAYPKYRTEPTSDHGALTVPSFDVGD